MAHLPRILLVDDDPAVRASLLFSLELQGFAVETYERGEDLAERTTFPDHGCLVLDYRLPGIDGVELLESLRQRGINLPAVLITSAPSRELRRRAAEAGAVIVEKPLLCDALTAAVRTGLADQWLAA